MRRALITITATVAGTAGVLAYSPVSQQGLTSLARGATTASPDAPAGDAAAGSAAAAQEWVTGDVHDTRWGQVQVSVQFEGEEIVDVQAVALPDADQRSIMLSERADAVLREEVLAAQSADVDLVSGATFTSEGYLSSVQAALDAHRA